MKPIQLYGDAGINPYKVVMVLYELNIPFEKKEILMADLKKPAYTAINPNGRLPAIHDPNTNLTLWESGAIVEYLVEKYDTERKISFTPGSDESYLAKTWLHFQMSGQGPYYGQASWFTKFHKEQLPSAIDRYVAEMNRVSGVLNDVLAQRPAGNDGPWLVGNKFSYADLVFVPWQVVITMVVAKEQFDNEKFEHLNAWLERMKQREAVKKALSEIKALK